MPQKIYKQIFIIDYFLVFFLHLKAIILANQIKKVTTNLKFAMIFNKYPAKNIWQYGIAFDKKIFVLKIKDV